MRTGEPGVGPFVLVSYAEADLAWADWLAWQLEEHGVTVKSYGWDAVPGSNRVRWLDRTTAAAERAFIVLSQAYLDADEASVQWQTMFDEASKSVRGKLVPVKVAPCQPLGLLGNLVAIDLIGLDEDAAQEVLLAGINAVDRGSYRPTWTGSRPPFPGSGGAELGRERPGATAGPQPPVDAVSATSDIGLTLFDSPAGTGATMDPPSASPGRRGPVSPNSRWYRCSRPPYRSTSSCSPT